LAHHREPRIAIIGAGMAGIATAVTLLRHGFGDFTLFEKGGDVGGVWHWNTYPGLTCDVPSNLYQFSFAPKPDWSHVWADGADIQRYHRDVVDRFDLAGRLRLNCEVVAAEYDSHDGSWQLTTADGAEHRVDFVIAATGLLHHPPETRGRTIGGACGRLSSARSKIAKRVGQQRVPSADRDRRRCSSLGFDQMNTARCSTRLARRTVLRQGCNARGAA
jgi:NAD(P)-binding Rossmann-like domain